MRVESGQSKERCAKIAGRCVSNLETSGVIYGVLLYLIYSALFLLIFIDFMGVDCAQETVTYRSSNSTPEG